MNWDERLKLDARGRLLFTNGDARIKELEAQFPDGMKILYKNIDAKIEERKKSEKLF